MAEKSKETGDGPVCHPQSKAKPKAERKCGSLACLDLLETLAVLRQGYFRGVALFGSQILLHTLPAALQCRGMTHLVHTFGRGQHRVVP
jgi:hypothetical protein